MAKEIPILFSTPMVKALLEGRKTMTRRILKGGIDPQPYNCVKLLRYERDDIGLQAFFFNEGDSDCLGIKSKCKVGDLLWVREKFRKYFIADEFGYLNFSEPTIEYAADNPELIYEQDGDGCQIFNKDGSEKVIPWKPSIFMPKEITRIWLEVVDIKVERVKDISEKDAVAEGLEFDYSEGRQYKNYYNEKFEHGDYRDSFQTLWQKVNGAESWEENPWVWVIQFKVLSTTGMNKNIEYLRFGHDLTDDYKNLQTINEPAKNTI